MFALAAPAFAEGTTVTVNLADLDSIARDAVLKAQAKADEAKKAAETGIDAMLQPSTTEPFHLVCPDCDYVQHHIPECVFDAYQNREEIERTTPWTLQT